MKIMMISSGYTPFSNGGVEMISQILAEELCEQGIKVVVLFFSDFEKIYYVGKVKVRVCRPRELKSKSEKLNCKVNRVLQMYNPFNKSIFMKILEEENPDIVHVQMLRKASYYVYKICARKNIPIITTLHEIFSLWKFNPFDKFKNMLLSTPNFWCEKIRDMQRKASKLVSVVTAPCQWIIDEYVNEKYYETCESVVIPNAIPIDYVQVDKWKNKKLQRIDKREKIKFLYIGRLDVFKGIELILDTMSDMKNENIEVHFAGKGPMKSLIEKKAMTDHRIVVHGYVAGEAKRKIFCDADVLLFLSDDIETFGLVCLEAMYYSLPIISTNIRSSRQFVKHGNNGVILKEKNKLQLKHSMKFYLDKKNLKSQILNSNIQLKKFDFKVFVKDTISLYKDILEKNKKEMI